MPIIEIERTGVTLGIDKGFIHLSDTKETIKTPIDDVDCVILNSYGATLSNHTLSRLCEYNIPLVVCTTNSLPIGMLLSTNQNTYRKSRIDAQTNNNPVLTKQMWQTIVKFKINNQARVCQKHGLEYKDLQKLALDVRSGDAGHAESVAARRYWQRLMGKDFRRDSEKPGVNGFLNYGYAIIRASFCRAIVAAGLLPELGIKHSNKHNAFCLADDLMEPFRPFVDDLVKSFCLNYEEPLTTIHKRALVALLDYQVLVNDKQRHLKHAIAYTVNLLVDSYEKGKNLLYYPYISI